MKGEIQLDKLLAGLAYCRRILLQLKDSRNIKHLPLIFKGFTPDKGLYYDFKTYKSENYIPDYKRYLSHVFINHKYKNLFKDKYSNFLYLRQYTDKLVPVYALVDNGKCYLLGHSSLDELFEKENKFVIKPRTGWGGKGVAVLEVKENKYSIESKAVEKEDIFKGFNNHVLVPYIRQHEYAADINPQSLNTIRFLTCIIGDKAESIGALHRFGVSSTGSVDNFSQGGISAKINVDTGIIEKACLLNKKKFKKLSITHHPDSNEPIVGLEIPFWQQIKKEILALHSSINYVKYVGWDIAITSDGYKIIESNHVSDIDVFQVHEPLLLNDLNKKFYDVYN
ncbi:sugar-transfer associated ATP-grasp domain-containing protein [Rubrolithibacter danxiaensis]|uniref:sugar-transfer associated ATP-grasp domain-containing protein n=1 Tax=Rubrolithibacter danxiaensis TaxID=3390805 RepID=UPI003BF8328F